MRERESFVASSELTAFNHFQLRRIGMGKGFFSFLSKFPSALAEGDQLEINDWRTCEKR